MHATLRASILGALLLLAGSVQHVAAQAQPHCDGKQNIIRISEIKPGMMPKFEEAVAAQRAYYKKIGSTDEILMMKVIDTNTHAWSATQAITEHKSDGSPRPSADQAAYDAFVALFKDSSEIKTQYVTCESK